ncbi:hypothetical protein BX666DRAFT_1867996 [Dichotomocladium elegans]|nr:hypothetical protein BX666DRAFT_1867996 [Dichotomocladium elegans]
MSAEESNRKVSKASLEANAILKTQIDASIGVARSLVESWLPAPRAGEKLEDDEDDLETFNRYSTGRPDRLGLGAKFLSHNEATKHQTQTLSKQEMHLRNKILNQNQKAAAAGKDGPSPSKRLRKDSENEGDSDDDDEEDSRIQSVARTTDTKQTPAKGRPSHHQGDFLSMMISERGCKGKKKNKKKKKSKTGATDNNQEEKAP